MIKDILFKKYNKIWKKKSKINKNRLEHQNYLW